MDFDKYYEMLAKGGPGSGKKGHSGDRVDKLKDYLKHVQRSHDLEVDPKEKEIFKKDIADLKAEIEQHSVRKSRMDFDKYYEMLAKGGPGSGRKGHTTNSDGRNKLAADAIKDSKAGEMYPLDSFMTDELDKEGGLDYMLNNEEEFKQKMVDKYEQNVGAGQGEFVKEAVTYSLAGVKAKLGLKKGGAGSGKKGHQTASHKMTSGTSAQTDYSLDKKFKHAPVNKDINVQSPNRDLWHHGDIPKGSRISNLAGGMHVKFPEGHKDENKGHRDYGVKINSHESNIRAVKDGLNKSRKGMDFDKYYELLAKGGPGSGKRGHMGVTPPKAQRERNRQKAGEAMQTSRDAKRIIAELDLNKEDLKGIRDYASAEGITPSQFIVNNKDHIKTNLKKGGPGSGRRGHSSSRPVGRLMTSPLDRAELDREMGAAKKKYGEPEVRGDSTKFKDEDGNTRIEIIKDWDKYIIRKSGMDFDKYYEMLEKGGPGSGKKGHKTSGKIEPKHFEPNPNLRDKNKGLDRLTPEQSAERKRKKEEFTNQRRKERLKERADAAHKAGNHKEYDKLIAQVRKINPHKGDPAAAGNKASRQDASGTRDEAHDLMSQMKAPGVGSKYQGNPAEEGNRASREDASGTRDLDQVYGDTGTKDKTKGDYSKLDLEQMRGGVPSMHERRKMKKSGEGSRGGKVVGHTKSGKPIYQGARDQKHASFDKRDHLDSANHKYKLAEEYSKKLQDKIKGDPKFEGEKANKIRSFIKDTHEQAGHHQRIANSKGDHEESRMTTGGELPASAVAPKHAKALAAIKKLRAEGDNETAKKVYDAYIKDSK